MKELISIQVGGYANFIGSHFWNLQDELLGLQNDPETNSCFSNCGVNFDVLYRVGETAQGLATYTPRLLAIDARGSLGACKATGSLYEQSPMMENAMTSWKGRVSKHTAEPHVRNEFQLSLEQEERDWQEGGQHSSGSQGTDFDEHKLIKSLEDTVQFWTDYSKVHYHPLSLYELGGIWHESSPFKDYGSGRGVLKGDTREEVLDRLRFFVEEADHMQGLQILVDDSGGFAAVVTDLLEAIVDEYDKSPVLLFTARPPSSFQNPGTFHASTLRELHDAISFSELASFSSCTVPLGLSSFAGMSRYMEVDDRKNFHTSAVYAAAVSCMTLPLRMEPSGRTSGISQQVYTGAIDMASLVHLLSGHMGRRVPILDLAMPAPQIPGPDKPRIIDFSSFWPLISGVIESDDDQAASEVVVVQGALSQESGSPTSMQDVLNCYSKKHTPWYHLGVSPCPLALPLPFPDIFSPLERAIGQSHLSSVPIASKLCSSAAILPYLEKRLQNLRQPTGGSFGWQILEMWGSQKDEVRELCERMSDIIAAYKNNTLAESTSDSE